MLHFSPSPCSHWGVFFFQLRLLSPRLPALLPRPHMVQSSSPLPLSFLSPSLLYHTIPFFVSPLSSPLCPLLLNFTAPPPPFVSLWNTSSLTNPPPFYPPISNPPLFLPLWRFISPLLLCVQAPWGSVATAEFKKKKKKAFWSTSPAVYEQRSARIRAANTTQTYNGRFACDSVSI